VKKGKWSAQAYKTSAGTDLHFLGPQPGTSWSCKTRNTGPNALHAVPVYVPAFTNTKLYCLVTETLS